MGIHRLPTRLGWTVVISAASLIAAATLYPAGQQFPTAYSACMLCGERAVADAMANVALFTPVGIGFALAGVAWHRGVIFGASWSCLIELAQIWIPGRFAGIGDVLSNTLGAGLGVFLAASATRWLYPTRRLARTLSIAWTIAAAGIAWATVLLLEPSYPKSVYYGQWTPNLGHLEWYRGRVLQARVGQVDVPPWRVPDSDAIRAELARRPPIAVRAIAGPPVPALASLFSIYDDKQREVVLVGPDRDDLIYRYRSRARALLLDSPDVRARGLLRGVETGDTLNVVASRADGDMCLSLNDRQLCDSAPGASAGWSLVFYTSRFPAWLVASLNAAWLVALALPIGYWSPDKRSLATLGGGLAVAVAGASTYAVALSPQVPIFLFAGLGLGALAQRGVRFRTTVSESAPD